MENREHGIDDLIGLLIMPAIALFESLDFGGNKRAESVRGGFQGIEQLFAIMVVPFLIPFMEMAESGNHGEGK